MNIKSIFRVFIVLVGLALNLGCNKEAEIMTASITPSISASIDGTFWKAEVISSSRENMENIKLLPQKTPNR